LLFLLPLLAAYELGVFYLGGGHPEVLRNGADSWLRRGLALAGLRQHYWTPALLLFVLVVWNYFRRQDRPGDLVGVLSGMAIESVAFALGLWGISRTLGPLVDYFGLELRLNLSTGPAGNPLLGQVITFVGAGIYEEMLFRLLLFSGLMALLRRTSVGPALAVAVAGLASAMFFSIAHHLGPYGEPFEGYTFLFRTVAGIYFAVLYQLRGFGIAVGAHACYDVIVGVTVG
jgi:membrane protease YdiL (CAAX protease family)